MREYERDSEGPSKGNLPTEPRAQQADSASSASPVASANPHRFEDVPVEPAQGLSQKEFDRSVKKWIADRIRGPKHITADLKKKLSVDFHAYTEAELQRRDITLGDLDWDDVADLQASFAMKNKSLAGDQIDEDVAVAQGEYLVADASELAAGLKTIGLGPCVAVGLHGSGPDGIERLALTHLDGDSDVAGIINAMLEEVTGGEEGLTIDAEVAGGSVNDPSHEMSGEELRAAVVETLGGKVDSLVEHEHQAGEIVDVHLSSEGMQRTRQSPRQKRRRDFK